jgi:hypothetical protein
MLISPLSAARQLPLQIERFACPWHALVTAAAESPLSAASRSYARGNPKFADRRLISAFSGQGGRPCRIDAGDQFLPR